MWLKAALDKRILSAVLLRRVLRRRQVRIDRPPPTEPVRPRRRMVSAHRDGALLRDRLYIWRISWPCTPFDCMWGYYAADEAGKHASYSSSRAQPVEIRRGCAMLSPDDYLTRVGRCAAGPSIRSPLDLCPIEIPELAAVALAGGLVDLFEEQRCGLVRCFHLKLAFYGVIQTLKCRCT
jgi:hypothetical protein